MEFNKNDAIYAARLIYPNASKVKELKSGYSHYAFEVFTEEFPESVIVRFANESKEKFGLGKEVRVMKILESIGVPVPRVILYDNTKSKFPFEFVILSKLLGEDLSDVWSKLSKKEQSEICFEMGMILGKIHKIKFDQVGYILPNGIDGNIFDMKKVGKKVKSNPYIEKELSESLHDVGLMSAKNIIHEEKIIKIIKEHIEEKERVYYDEEPSLIHGDFEYRNLKVKKVNGKWKICGVLDFELSAAHAREYDFIKLHRSGFLTMPHLKNPLLDGYKKYQKIDGNFIDKVIYFRAGRDIGFANVLLDAGDIDFANKVIDKLLSGEYKNGEKLW